MGRFVAPLPPERSFRQSTDLEPPSRSLLSPRQQPLLPPRPSRSSSGALNSETYDPAFSLDQSQPDAAYDSSVSTTGTEGDLLQAPAALDIPSIKVELEAESPLLSPAATFEEDDEGELSESQLRELYDQEEIDRFLHMFSAYVTEVTMPESSNHRQPSRSSPPLSSERHDIDEEETVNTVPSADNETVMSEGRTSKQYNGLAERVAKEVVLPHLPPLTSQPQAFTLGRLRMASQRLYLATEPAYRPFIVKAYKLATWKNWNHSCFWCSLFWLLWFQNLLLPALILRLLWSLLRRRIVPYPSRRELLERRQELARAEQFGEDFAARMTGPTALSSSGFGVREVWQVARELKSWSSSNVGGRKKKDKDKEPPTLAAVAEPAGEENTPRVDEPTSLDLDGCESDSEHDIKQLGLSAMTELADLHERVRNIFLWRKPQSSRVYGAVIFVLFLVTLLVPAQYLAKMVYASLGVLFWFVLPVLDALPSAALARFPPVFNDVPTDVDFAMELISQRVANGQDVQPMKRKRKRPFGASISPIISQLSLGAGASSLQVNDDNEPEDDGESDALGRPKDWVCSAVQVANTGKMWMGEGARIAQSLKRIAGGQSPPTSPVASKVSLNQAQSEESHPFIAQHIKGPGLITLTARTFTFTPAVSRNNSAKIGIPLHAVRGIKKIGIMGAKGLSLRWVDPDSDGEELTEKFLWIRGRDEVFARVVGGGSRWMRV